jgi:plastocyanin
VIAISAVLVLGAVGTAVLTSSVPAKGTVPPNKTQELAPVPSVSAPVEQSTNAAESAPAAAAPAATTGTPAPASSPSPGQATTRLALAANPTGLLAYNTKQLSARAGTVTITMANASPLEHDVAVAEGTKVLGKTPVFKGGTRTLTLTLKPGKYVFYCTVPGHRQAGMEGTLTVSAAAAPVATTGTPAPASSPAAGKATTRLALAANPTGLLAYNTKQLSAKAGIVTIAMTNASPLEHDVAVAEGTKVLGQTPVFKGGTRTLTLNLKPGKYVFYCTVPGHRQAGMEGTLEVS